MTPPSPVLSVKNICKTFVTRSGSYTALDDVSFSLDAGEILGLLGPNGAGKTTIIQILLSTLKQTSGSIHFFGKEYATNRSAILQHVGFASTYVGLPGHLTIRENLFIHGRLYGLGGAQLTQIVDTFINIFRLGDLQNKETGQLSAGQKTRVMLAKAFLTNPKIVLLDEPTAALDPDIAQEIRSYIHTACREHTIALLFTSHNMHEITTLCDRVLVLKDGKLIANEKPHTLATSVATTRVQLFFADNQITAQAVINQLNVPTRVQDDWIEITIDEHSIAQLLTHLAHNNILYTHIAIAKPSLEDYFLHIAHNRKD